MGLTTANIDYAMACQPFGGGEFCGDFALVKIFDERVFFATIDVAGHGEQADVLAKTIKDFLEDHYNAGLLELISALHEKIRGSRGCAGSFGTVNLADGKLRYVGVGNVCGRLIGKRNKRFVNRSGVIGYILPSLREEQYQMAESDTLMLYSDGIKEHFELSGLENISQLAASEITDYVMKTFGKGTDDAICLVIKSRA